jgi:hypothetical protein
MLALPLGFSFRSPHSVCPYGLWQPFDMSKVNSLSVKRSRVSTRVVTIVWRVALAGGVVYALDWYDMLKIVGGGASATA